MCLCHMYVFVTRRVHHLTFALILKALQFFCLHNALKADQSKYNVCQFGPMCGVYLNFYCSQPASQPAGFDKSRAKMFFAHYLTNMHYGDSNNRSHIETFY